jgi:predicted Rossmann fold flavoprotein
MLSMPPRGPADLAVAGAGAAGLMAAIVAGRRGRRVVVLDGARTLGAKILVSGGGRCNVTHERVDETAFAGSTPAAIRKVLRRFDVPETVAFFRELGVELKREDTGKLFPATDRAWTVLEALLQAAREAGVEVVFPWRVAEVRARAGGGFVLRSSSGTTLEAGRVVLATGGKSLPKTGSDGGGYALACALGHTLTPRVFPALVPLTLPAGHFACGLSGLSLPASLGVRAGGRRRASFTGAVLCTHFGLSGPAVLDISRYWIDARQDHPAALLAVNWLPGRTAATLDAELQALGKARVGRFLGGLLPERLAAALSLEAGVDPSTPGHRLERGARLALTRLLTDLPLPVTGDRGFGFAEVTAGGVPLAELRLETLESRPAPGLHLCGEICDVDGRIGGFNFQWAWASGYVAGLSA